ncbi:MAG: hypothetical protein TE42_06425 [Candidatus Synechococcus spongiarum SP3]|uniref:Uncharacterized protein n=1 Tax=Candidatus Synechococcus spongiarum SP3 TaxID=1604020 RepID=A0A0G2HKH6_9SYNE|nr:MAG: hypothetical protein TE42_06425 [Candidatus Synechococcus spongiarum SP3]
MTAEAERTAEDGLLLEFPLREHHHRIISTFMAEQMYDSSSDGPGICTNRLPIPRVLQRSAVRLRDWWSHRRAPS